MVSVLTRRDFPPCFAVRRQSSATTSALSVWKLCRSDVWYMRAFGSLASAPISRTWPRICPMAFWDRALPKWAPRPQKIVAAFSTEYVSIGRPLINSKPIPDVSFFCNSFNLFSSRGNGNVSLEIVPSSPVFFKNWSAAYSSCSISRSDQRECQRPVFLANSLPIQADGLEIIDGGNSSVILSFTH